MNNIIGTSKNKNSPCLHLNKYEFMVNQRKKNKKEIVEASPENGYSIILLLSIQIANTPKKVFLK